MSEAADAWSVVLLAELVRSGEELLLRALRLLDVDARVGMPPEGGWILGGGEADELRVVLDEHAEIAERLRALAERLPVHGVVATYADVRDGAAAALAEGILDPGTLLLAACALDAPCGWAALAEALSSTDARCGWGELEVATVLAAFRDVKAGGVRRVLAEADVESAARWSDLDEAAVRRLAAALAVHAARS